MKELMQGKAYKLRATMLVLMDILIIQLASFLSLYIRYDFKFNDIDKKFLHSIVKYAPVNTVTILLVFLAFRLYSSLWKYASVDELIKVIYASLVCFVIEIVEMKFFSFRVPRSHPFMFVTILMAGTVSIRFAYRFLRVFKYEYVGEKTGVRTMIVGGGQASAMLMKEIKISNYANYNVICMIDDDVRKKGKYISGVKVICDRNDIISAVDKYQIEQIIIAMPSADKKVIRDILDICNKKSNHVHIYILYIYIK